MVSSIIQDNVTWLDLFIPSSLAQCKVDHIKHIIN